MLTRKLVASKKKREEKKKERRKRAWEIRRRDFGKKGERGRERSRGSEILLRTACGQRRMHRVAPAGDYARGISTRTRAADQSIRKIYGTDDGARGRDAIPIANHSSFGAAMTDVERYQERISGWIYIRYICPEFTRTRDLRNLRFRMRRNED